MKWLGNNRTYGPTAIATPANFVTVARIMATPIFVLLVITKEPMWLTFLVGFAIGITDSLDGWLARKHGETRSGAFLDPLADKVLVLGGMCALVSIGQFHWLPVSIIMLRELLVSVYRSKAGRKGITVPATRLAKWKTFVQLWAIGFAVIPPIESSSHWVATALLWLATLLTLQTGVGYWISARKLAAEQLGSATLP